MLKYGKISKKLTSFNMTSIPPLGKISRDNFKKILTGSKSYLPKKVAEELKAAGINYNKPINKQQAIKAIKFLQGKGLVSRYKPPSELWQESQRLQQDQ